MRKLSRLVLSVFLLTSTLSGQAGLPNTTSEKLEAIFRLPFFDTCIAALEVEDLAMGATVFSKNKKLLLHPASNMKLYSSAAALQCLGGDYEFRTKITYSGTINDGILEGDLIFTGGGDPDFTHKDFDTVIRALAALGIREIRGNLVANVALFDSMYWGKGWMWDDDPSTDAPYLTPLAMNKNCVTIQASYDAGTQTVGIEMTPRNDYCVITQAVNRIGNLPSAITIDRNWYDRKNEFIIQVAAGKNSVRAVKTVNVMEPALFFLQSFATYASLANIKIHASFNRSRQEVPGKLLLEIRRPILPVLENLNKMSDNLSAELSLRVAASQTFNVSEVSSKQSLQLIDSLIVRAGMHPANYRIVDASGVSHYNLISAELTLALLRFMYLSNPVTFEQFRKTLPIGGLDGTLAKRMKEMEIRGNVFAKTGTLSGVSTLSGYIETKSRKILGFSLMMQNFYGRLAYAQSIQDEICQILYNDAE